MLPEELSLVGGTGFEPATSTMSTSESPIVSDDTKGLTNGDGTACTTACTSEADLEQIAADLRDRLTVDECRQLAELLSQSDNDASPKGDESS